MTINLVGTWDDGVNVVRFDSDGTWQRPGRHGPRPYQITRHPQGISAEWVSSPTGEYLALEPPIWGEFSMSREFYSILRATRDELAVQLVAGTLFGKTRCWTDRKFQTFFRRC